MTDLKRVSVDPQRQGGVSYLWVRSRRGKKDEPKRVPARGKKEDPMSVPWGDMVETPLKLFFKRLFERS